MGYNWGTNPLPTGCKTKVAVAPYKHYLRVRFTANGKRHQILTPDQTQISSYKANLIKHQIERDLLDNQFDETLQRYKDMLRKTALAELIQEQQQVKASNLSRSIIETPVAPVQEGPINFLEKFDDYCRWLELDLDNLTTYYLHCRNMMERWGKFTVDQVPHLLKTKCAVATGKKNKLKTKEPSGRTFNYRRSCLKGFFDWLVKKRVILENPVENIKPRKEDKFPEDRRPFTESEARRILEAFRTDQFKAKCSGYTHSQYYPFIAFMFHTGIRNAEAIGLRVRDVDLEACEVTISHALARDGSCTNPSARYFKETKNNNVRVLPMDQYLYDLLEPLCRGKKPKDLVFQNYRGNAIDDRMLQRRVWSKILDGLNISKRDLYACRHTFATRAVRQGMKPHEVAYLMGDNLDTVLERYFHNNQRPDSLPLPATEVVQSHQMRIIKKTA